MSESVSALNGAAFDGIARIEEAGLQGMITLRGDLGAKKMAAAVKSVAGVAMPGPGEILFAKSASVAWMSPDELLIMTAHDEAPGAVARLEEALAGEHAMAVNVSDARAVFRISGAHAREVLGKLAPVDFSPDAFAPGHFRRSRAAQVPAAIWADEDGGFGLVCFRSAGQYMFDLLSVAAASGSEVGVYAG